MDPSLIPALVVLFLVVWSLGLVGIFALWRFIAARIRRSEAVAAAVALVEANPEAREFLGAPVQVGLLIFGRFYNRRFSLLAPFAGGSSDGGYASLSLPLRGTRKGARLRVRLEKIDGAWLPFYGRMWLDSRKLVLIDRKPKHGWFKRHFLGG